MLATKTSLSARRFVHALPLPPIDHAMVEDWKVKFKFGSFMTFLDSLVFAHRSLAKERPPIIESANTATCEMNTRRVAFQSKSNHSQAYLVQDGSESRRRKEQDEKYESVKVLGHQTISLTLPSEAVGDGKRPIQVLFAITLSLIVLTVLLHQQIGAGEEKQNLCCESTES